MNKRGVKEVLYEGLSRGEKDFNALVTKIASVKPDVVYFGGCHPEAGPLVRQMREQGVTAKFFSGDCVVTEELVTAAGGPQYTNGVLMTFGNDPRLIPEGKAVIAKFRASGFEPEGYTLYSYASIQGDRRGLQRHRRQRQRQGRRMAEVARRRYRDGQESTGSEGRPEGLGLRGLPMG